MELWQIHAYLHPEGGDQAGPESAEAFAERSRRETVERVLAASREAPTPTLPGVREVTDEELTQIQQSG